MKSFKEYATCRQGHVYDDSNTYWRVTKNGYRYKTCRICQRASEKRRYHAARLRDRGQAWEDCQ